MAEDNPFAKYAAPPSASPAPEGNPFATYAPAPSLNDFSDVPPPSGRQPLRLTVTPTLPPEGDIGAGGAASIGAMQGATFNFGDELAGVAAAGGPQPTDITGRASGAAAARVPLGIYNLIREKLAG